MEMKIAHLVHLKRATYAQMADDSTENQPPPEETPTSLVDFEVGLRTEAEHLSGRVIIDNPDRFEKDDDRIKQIVQAKIIAVLGGEIV